MGYKQKVNRIEVGYKSNINNLKDKYFNEVSELDDYKDHARDEKRQELKAKYIKELERFQAIKDKELLDVYNKELEGIQKTNKTLDDITEKEMQYIKVILDSKDTHNIQKLATKYADNIDVGNMISASIKGLNDYDKNNIIHELNRNRLRKEELNNEINQVGFFNSMDEINLFKRR